MKPSHNAILLIVAFVMGANISFAQGGQSNPSISSSLEQARRTLLKSAGSGTIGDTLRSLASVLVPSDSITLFKEFIPKVPSKDKFALNLQAANLAVLCGQYQDAAFFYSQAGVNDSVYRIKAARFFLATGEIEHAQKQISEIPKTSRNGLLSNSVALIEGWVDLFSGKCAEALSLADATYIGKSANSQDKLEALFISWLAARIMEKGSANVPAGFDSVSIAKRLRNEFPDSAELGIIDGKVGQTANLMFLFAALLGGNAKAVSTAQSVSVPPTDGSQPVSGNGKAVLHAGWFSIEENAIALQKALEAKHFSASVVKQTMSQGETRWAVLVDAGTDWAHTQALLKDAGYESYFVP
jgi:hypothetical protein